MHQQNPYAPPADLQTPPPLVVYDDLFRREGDFLLAWDGAVLPARCVRTNQPIDADGVTKARKLTWCPSWIWVFVFLGGLLITLILSIVLRKQLTLTYSLTGKEKARFRNRAIFGWLGFVGGFAIMISGIGGLASSNESWPMIALLGGIVLMLAGVVSISRAAPLQAVAHINGWFRMKGFSKEFLDSIGPA